MDGVIDVSSVTVKGGKIVLGGGDKGVVKVAGDLKADGQTGGGKVEATGQNIHLTETATVAASALTTGDGGVVDIIAQDGLVYGGSIVAKGGVFGGNGGAVDTSGLGWVDVYGTVDASAHNGANGTWLIDPTNLTITDLLPTNVGGNGSAANPFKPDGDFVSILRNNVVNAALTGGTNVTITTVNSPNQALQDGTITVMADITSAGSGTLTLQAAGSIIVESGRTIAASIGNTLNVVMDAVKGISLHGAAIDTRGGSVNFKAGDSITLTGLTQIDTHGGAASFNSTAGSFIIGNGSAVNSGGGKIDVRALGPVTTALGLPATGNIDVKGVLNAGGGHIDLRQSALFIGDADSLSTSGTGTISLQQNSFESGGVQFARIQTAIDAISNSGTGANTVTVSAGTFKESLRADVNNLVLKGAKANVAGSHASRGTGETVINPNSPGVHVTANNVTVDGLTFANAAGGNGYGIYVDGATNAIIKNNVVYNTSQHGIFSDGANGIQIHANKVTNTREDGIHVTDSTGTVRITNNIVGETASNIDGNGIHVEKTDGAVLQWNTLYNIAGDSAIYIKESDYVTVGYWNNGADRGTNKIWGATNNGITVEDSEFVNLFFNSVAGAGRYGIEGIDNDNLQIHGNWVRQGEGLTDIGIYAHGGTNIDIGNNWVELVAEGVRIESVGGTDNVSYGNRVKNFTLDGYYVNNVAGITIEKNVIFNGTGSGNGIYVTGSDSSRILRNEITDVGGNGILLDGSHGSKLERNTITNPRGAAGIYVLDSDRVTVGVYNSGADRGTNKIWNATNNGITINGGEGTNVYFNTIDSAGGYGIESIDTTDLDIFGNWVRNGVGKTDIGIYAHGGGDFNATNNWVESVIEGIRLESIAGDKNVAYGNRVKFLTNDGIYADNVSNLVIEKNRVSNTGGNGIVVYDNQGSDIVTNEVWETDMDGIAVYDGDKVVIFKNKVTDAGDNGIKTDGVRKVIVKENEVIDAVNDGITLLGYADYTGELPDIGNEDNGEEEAPSEVLTLALAEEGEDSPGPWKAIVKKNKVSGSDDDGIQIEGFETIIVTDRNEVSDSTNNGLYVSGYSNGHVVVSGNVFTANNIGAQFESGLIDLTGEGNVFNGGRIGLRFAPYEFGEEGGGEKYEYAPAFAKIDMALLEASLPTSGYAPLKLVDDGQSYPNVPGTFDGTIGAQIFKGYTQAGKYYVQLANEAFFYPGTPTLLNGLNSTYEDIKPWMTDGIISPEDLEYLETRFHHYPDGLTTEEDLGLFWFDTPQNLAAFAGDQKDLFNNFNTFNGGTSGLNVRIVGLPRLPGQGGSGTPGNAPQNLNNIETFGGSPASLNEIETSAGGNDNAPQELAEIETEAGENSDGGDTNCWSDAMTIAGGGQSVNVVYQGTLDDSLEQAAACGTAF